LPRRVKPKRGTSKPTIPLAMQDRIDATVAEYGKNLIVEIVGVAKRRGDTIVVDSHIEAAMHRLKEDTTPDRRVQAAMVFGGAGLAAAAAEFISQIKAKPIDPGSVTVCVLALLISTVAVVWGIMRG